MLATDKLDTSSEDSASTGSRSPPSDVYLASETTATTASIPFDPSAVTLNDSEELRMFDMLANTSPIARRGEFTGSAASPGLHQGAFASVPNSEDQLDRLAAKIHTVLHSRETKEDPVLKQLLSVPETATFAPMRIKEIIQEVLRSEQAFNLRRLQHRVTVLERSPVASSGSAFSPAAVTPGYKQRQTQQTPISSGAPTPPQFNGAVSDGALEQKLRKQVALLNTKNNTLRSQRDALKQEKARLRDDAKRFHNRLSEILHAWETQHADISTLEDALRATMSERDAFRKQCEVLTATNARLSSEAEQALKHKSDLEVAKEELVGLQRRLDESHRAVEAQKKLLVDHETAFRDKERLHGRVRDDCETAVVHMQDKVSETSEVNKELQKENVQLRGIVSQLREALAGSDAEVRETGTKLLRLVHNEAKRQAQHDESLRVARLSADQAIVLCDELRQANASLESRAAGAEEELARTSTALEEARSKVSEYEDLLTVHMRKSHESEQTARVNVGQQRQLELANEACKSARQTIRDRDQQLCSSEELSHRLLLHVKESGERMAITRSMLSERVMVLNRQQPNASRIIDQMNAMVTQRRFVAPGASSRTPQ